MLFSDDQLLSLMFLDVTSSYLAFLISYSRSKSFIGSFRMKGDPLTKKNYMAEKTPKTKTKMKGRGREKNSFFKILDLKTAAENMNNWIQGPQKQKSVFAV